MMLSRFLTTLLVIHAVVVQAAADYPHTPTPFAKDRAVASVKFHPADNPEAPPSLRLATADSLVLSFDIISTAHSDLRAELAHFNADWSPSGILPSEFNNDWNEALIDDWQYSAPVFTPYVNYRLCLPSPGLRPSVSGNYTLRIYPEDYPDSTVLLVPFDVSENILDMSIQTSTDTQKGFNSEWQELKILVSGQLPDGTDPFSQLWITVDQNLDPNSSQTVAHPVKATPGEVLFANSPELVFAAGNEFRRFDTLQTSHPGLGAAETRFADGVWHSFLTTDRPRSNQAWTFDNTRHGQFTIDDFNSSDPDLGADYVTVHFSLETDSLPDSQVFVDGAFSSHRFTDDNMMHWNRRSGRYEAQIPLKQGTYDYRYVALPSRPGALPDAARIEGNHFQTSNLYHAKAFCRPPGTRHDRLVATATADSHPR